MILLQIIIVSYVEYKLKLVSAIEKMGIAHFILIQALLGLIISPSSLTLNPAGLLFL
jgi:hypothetical protein